MRTIIPAIAAVCTLSFAAVVLVPAPAMSAPQGHSMRAMRTMMADMKAKDPQGYAARQDLFARITADAQSNPNRPLAEDLQNSINQTLQNAGHLDAKGLEEVQGGVRGNQPDG